MSTVVICPIKDSAPGPALQSAFTLAAFLQEIGERPQMQTSWLCSNLAKARMLLVRSALESRADQVLLLDDDIVHTPNDFATLAAADVDIVSGAYSFREPGGTTVGYPLSGGETRGRMLEMLTVGMGYLLVKRKALVALVEAHGDDLFEMRRDLGEDELLSQRWRSLGGQLWLHTAVQLGHVGPCIYRPEASA